MRKNGKPSHAGYIADLNRRTHELELKQKIMDREILLLRRHAGATPQGRELLIKLRSRRVAWLDEIRPEQRDVP